MKTFALLPHELPPGCTAPLQAPADCVFEWQGSEVSVRQIAFSPTKYALYLKTPFQSGIFCASEVLGLSLWDAPIPREKIEKIARLNFSGQHQLKQICFLAPRASGAVPVALIRTSRFATWLGAEFHLAASFRFSSHKSEPLLAQHLSETLENHQSDAAFAWRWINLTHQERRRIFYANDAILEAANQTARWVLQATPTLWKNASICQLEMDQTGNITLYPPKRNNHFWSKNGKHLKHWFAFWRAMIPSKHQRPRTKNHLCLKCSWFNFLQIRVVAPTFHEQLEARLQLESWLDQNVSPQLKAKLLPPEP